MCSCGFVVWGCAMLRMKRMRWPKKDLTARYKCPRCGQVEEFTVALRPWSDRDPTPDFYGRPTRAECDCRDGDGRYTEMTYCGFVSV